MNNFNKYFDILPEVKEALDDNKPVVALESTIISHGFNYPENLECGRECERQIREAGAVPATIAIIGGKVKIGLTPKELEFLASTKGIIKCSRKDLAAILSQGENGATTVAGTMLLAGMAGIKVFATGGIGGVHREGHNTFDISADLEELGKTNVAVVCAGAKSILDLKLTREYLETAGVPIIGYNTDDFPAFYTRQSGEKVDYNIKTPKEISKLIATSFDLGLKGGMVICNPIPKENQLDSIYIEEKIHLALEEANKKAITGKDITPFLLGRLVDITEGKSVSANKALVYNNSKVAGEIAVELHRTLS